MRKSRSRRSTRMPMRRAAQRTTSRSSRRVVTPRQEEILRLVAEGLTNREIGSQLDISARTVEVHRYNLMRRLQAHNVAQLIRGALQHRILSRRFLTHQRTRVNG